ncbi:MAG: hypothetical protein ACO23H_03230 [Alphaproteobacteria bacterium]
MITVYYNGVALKDCVVKRFQQEIVHDSSNTDVMYSRFVVTVESTVVGFEMMDNPSFPDNFDGSGSPPNRFASVPRIEPGDDYSVANTFAEIGRRLGQARKDFWLVCGGQTPGNASQDYEETLLIAAGFQNPNAELNVIPQNPRFTSDDIDRFSVLDVEMGPHVHDVSIEQLWGGKAMRVSATFRVARSLCHPSDYYDDPKPNLEDVTLIPDEEQGVILSNRWSLEESKDENWKTTRKLTGTLRTRHADYFAQNYRTAVFPPLMAGYRRVSQNFASDATNCLMQYTIVDKQEYAAPPAPAIDWSCSHTETTTMQGATQAAQINIRLVGDQDVDKRELQNTAAKILSLRIQDLQHQPNDNNNHAVIKQMSVSDQVDQPVIEMNAQVLYTTAEYTHLQMRLQTMFAGRGGNLVENNDPAVAPITPGIPGYDPTAWPRPLAYDSETPTGQLACYLQRPCSVWHGMVGLPEEPVDRNYRPEEATAYPPDSYDYGQILPTPTEDDVSWDKPSISSDGTTVTPKEDKWDVYRFPYTLYTYSTTWETPQGKMHLPYMEDGGGTPSSTTDIAAVVKLNKGLTRLYYEIEAVRTGRYPTVPELVEEIEDENDNTYYLLEHTITMRPPEITADGITKRMGIAMRAIYGATVDKVQAGSVLNAGALPVARTTASEAESSIALSEISDDENRLIAGGLSDGGEEPA